MNFNIDKQAYHSPVLPGKMAGGTTQIQSPQNLNVNIHDQISNFIQGAWIEQTGHEAQPGTSGQNILNKMTEQPETSRSVAARMIADAEKFQADIAQPQGMFHAGDGPKHTEIDNRYFIGVKGQEGQVIDDDEFFHVTCHINSNTAQKIE